MPYEPKSADCKSLPVSLTSFIVAKLAELDVEETYPQSSASMFHDIVPAGTRVEGLADLMFLEGRFGTGRMDFALLCSGRAGLQPGTFEGLRSLAVDSTGNVITGEAYVETGGDRTESKSSG
jgi:hypothetical protein